MSMSKIFAQDNNDTTSTVNSHKVGHNLKNLMVCDFYTPHSMTKPIFDFIQDVNQSDEINDEIKAVGCNGCSLATMYYVAQETHKEYVYIKYDDIVKAEKIQDMAEDTDAGVTVEWNGSDDTALKIEVEE
jgi:hypothetical protein